ncbi:MAG TPA: S9 family peptidase [Rhizomicrobium sp.]|jgi:dipeptidyl aminopeptidase/acylaminoacyl peptidase|nr:S9 family peptidase [Rhizomicrobium sp.]
MRLWRAIAGIAFIASIGAAHGAPLEAYGQLPSLNNLEISPDGKNLAFETTYNGDRVVVVRSLETGAVLAVFKIGDQKLRALTWADSDHLLSTLSVTDRAIGIEGPRQEYFLTQSYSLAERKSIALLDHVDNAMNVVYGAPQPRIVGGHTLVFVTGVSFLNDMGVPTLFCIDLTGGHTTLVERGSKNSLDWVVDESGNMVAKSEYDESLKRWSLKFRRDNSWVEVYGADASIESPVVDGIGPDGTALIVDIPKDGTFEERQLRFSDGAWLPAPDMGDSMSDLVTDPVTHRIIGTQQLEVGTSYLFFDRGDQSAWNSLMSAFQGENVELVSWSDDRKHVVVRVDGARDGAAYHLVDLTTLHAQGLGPVYSGLHPEDVADVRLLTYRAADGTQIPAYLTLPSGWPAKDLPLVVLPHGGPAARDMPELDWWSQALASRGYAVLQPQFRGSDGFGWKHLSAGFGEWGRKMQTDLSDGVRFLAAQGTIDPKRVCIVGASYGGYAALAGPTLDPGVYRCAIAVSGISDPRGFLRWRRNRDHTSDDRTLRYWERFMGVTDYDDPRLAEIAPIFHIAAADVPILLIHGRDDTVVPIEQSEDMEDALKSAKKPVTFVKLDGEDHWLSRSETRLQMLQATVSFLEANNPPN